MAEEQGGLHIDTDWKKQAQEEKRKLAEQEKQKAEQGPKASPFAGAAPAGGEPPGGAGRAAGAGRGAAGARELPPASFGALVQSIMTQILFYLGDLATRGSEPIINLDMAKHQIDILGVLEEKTKGNLTDDEKRLLDSALYETRMRYVSVSSQYIT